MESSSAGGRHEHIVGVCTAYNTYYPRADVVAGIQRGKDWHTKGSDGSNAKIKHPTRTRYLASMRGNSSHLRPGPDTTRAALRARPLSPGTP